MIKDNIKRAEIYYGISKNLKQGFEWIKSNDLMNMPDGRYDLGGGNYANVQSYETKDDAPFEAHRKYMDIQYIISGEENCGVGDYANFRTVEAYSEEKDIEFLEGSCGDYYTLKSGEFFVFFPHDTHKPALDSGKKRFVKKVIVKVLV